jgi:uncharacterized Zn-finger protein
MDDFSQARRIFGTPKMAMHMTFDPSSFSCLSEISLAPMQHWGHMSQGEREVPTGFQPVSTESHWQSPSLQSTTYNYPAIQADTSHYYPNNGQAWSTSYISSTHYIHNPQAQINYQMQQIFPAQVQTFSTPYHMVQQTVLPPPYQYSVVMQPSPSPPQTLPTQQPANSLEKCTQPFYPDLIVRVPCLYTGCAKTFSARKNMLTHMKSHSGDRPFVCGFPNCGKAFALAGILRVHCRIHTGERPFPCLFKGCTKEFKESGSLIKHMRIHTGERPFQCAKCGRAFNQSGHLLRHDRFVHRK